ncbi:AcrR family transcriptional regulator/transposase [Catenulispora sp. GAS73]|uniref:helix-turn-helix domain-containing protein n=1 Tax=Catenulispora sp. GAS73 TaxID=3156269 RepID=UPI00351159E4
MVRRGRPSAEVTLGPLELRELRARAGDADRPIAAQRARIVLACAEGRENTEIAEELGIDRDAVSKWRNRFMREGLDGLSDRPRPGRPPEIDADRVARVRAAASQPPPEGAVRWTDAALAERTGLSRASVGRIRRGAGSESGSQLGSESGSQSASESAAASGSAVPAADTGGVPAAQPASPEEDVAARRRGEQLRSAIFEAVFAQLDAVGYSRLTMEGVAAQARTGKTALYRRWPNKEALVADALQDALPSPTEVTPGQSVREDLLALLACMREAFESKHSAAFHAIQAEPGPGTDLVRAVVRRRVSDPCRRMILAALRRGVDRGEVEPRAATAEVANVGPAMLIYHRLTVRPDITDEYLATVVDEIVLPMIRPVTDQKSAR